MIPVDGDAAGMRAVPGHPWIGQRVFDPATGRAGRLALVVEHTSRPAGPGEERVVWREAHVRPDDGSGWEWQANLDELRRGVGRA